MKREQLIQKYEDMMYEYGECDMWDDDIEPKLGGMTTEEIKKNYEADKKYYKARELAGGQF